MRKTVERYQINVDCKLVVPMMHVVKALQLYGYEKIDSPIDAVVFIRDPGNFIFHWHETKFLEFPEPLPNPERK